MTPENFETTSRQTDEMAAFNDIHSDASDANVQILSQTKDLLPLAYQYKLISQTFKKSNVLWFDIPGYTLTLFRLGGAGGGGCF